MLKYDVVRLSSCFRFVQLCPRWYEATASATASKRLAYMSAENQHTFLCWILRIRVRFLNAFKLFFTINNLLILRLFIWSWHWHSQWQILMNEMWNNIMQPNWTSLIQKCVLIVIFDSSVFVHLIHLLYSKVWLLKAADLRLVEA